MSRRHLVFVVLLFLALCPTITDEVVLSLLGMERDRPAWCPVPIDTTRALEIVPTWQAEPESVCPMQASSSLVTPEALSCPAEP